MLVITANWGGTDGSLWRPCPARPAEWLSAVHRAILRGGFGRDGSYRPIDRIDIVFAGDTFDCLGSRRWVGGVRPWHGGAASRAIRAAVMLAAARRARRLFAPLGRWVAAGLPVPTADRRGRPRPLPGRRADVRVTLLAGDRDRWIDEAADAARRHGHAVGHAWASADVVVRHGAELDPLWTAGDGAGEEPLRSSDRQPLLGESLAVDLVVRFAATLSDDLPSRPAIRTLLAAVGTSRAVLLPVVVSRWLDAGTGGRSLGAAPRAAIHAAWKRSVAAWHREAIRHPPACGLEACPVDALAAWLEAGPSAAARVAAVVAALEPRLGAAPRRSVAPLTTVLGHVAPPAVHAPPPADLVCLGGPGPRTLVRGPGAEPGWEILETAVPEAAVIGPGGTPAGRTGDTVVDAICDTTSDTVGHAA